MTDKFDGLYHREVNGSLNLYDENGKIQFDADREAARRYMVDEVNANYRFFHNLEEKRAYLIQNGYWDEAVVDIFSFDDFKALMKHAYAKRFRFPTYMGAVKFFGQYALKSNDGKNWLERYEDRVVLTAIFLADGSLDLAYALVDDMMCGAFQPATPTFLNAGKKQRGEFSSCYLLRTEDNTESILRTVASSAQLSKRGGGVGICLTNIRSDGAPIKGIEGASSGIVPFMKMLEDTFSYFNQLGARQGAGAVYLNAHHPQILTFLDTKRENADEKLRIKTLSLGIVMPDITFELAKQNKDMYLFEPYDVERVYGAPLSDISVTEKYEEMVADKRIAKRKISARDLFMTIAELQFESGYPYLMFEDTVNRENQIDGRIIMSNLCSEILQVQTPSSYTQDLNVEHAGEDIVCNLGSVNIASAMKLGPEFGAMISHAVHALTTVSDAVDVGSVPSIEQGNNRRHAIGLGAMNLHGALAEFGLEYGSPEALDFTDVYFMTQAYHAFAASNSLAEARGETFYEFEKSGYRDGSAFDKYIGDDELGPKTEIVSEVFRKSGVDIPTRDDWADLAADIMEHGLYNAYLMAIAPTGSISYVNHSTSSIHPVVAPIEARKEGKLGRVYSPAYGLTDDNMHLYQDAYELGYEKVIDTYAAAQKHIDQGISCTLFYKNTHTTRDLSRAYIYAWKKGLKTLYYARIKSDALAGTEIEGCVSCAV